MTHIISKCVSCSSTWTCFSQQPSQCQTMQQCNPQTRFTPCSSWQWPSVC